MLSLEFLLDLAEKVSEALKGLEERSLTTLCDLADGGQGEEVSVPHILAGIAVEEGRRRSFMEALFEMMERKGADFADVASRVGWTLDDLNGLRTDERYCPTKEAAVAFGLALELDREEADRLLASAGYAFLPDEVYDMIVLYCMERQVFGLPDINEALKCFNLKTIAPKPARGKVPEAP
ncbi:MAG: hypothetical protein Q4A13_04735 [Fretibacterium sp.]|nr:hypothetical protein [Fretibacterium sp.]